MGMTYQINTFERTKWAYEVLLALLSLDPSGSLSLETAFVWRVCCLGLFSPLCGKTEEQALPPIREA